jgi:hypothetical protein
MFVLVASFISAEEHSIFNNDEIEGTWINPEYRGGYTQEQKWVVYHWGYWESYSKVESTSYMYKGTFHTIDKWTDSDGNIVYKNIMRYSGGRDYWYEFGRISEDGGTWEYSYSNLNFPNESDLNIDNAHYRIYYRQ